MARKYLPEVHAFIVENVKGRTCQELTDLVNAQFGLELTVKTMKSYKNNYGLKSGTPCGLPKGRATELYPSEIRSFITEKCVGVGPTEMTTLLNEKFGTNYTRGQIKGFYANHGINSGLNGRFEKGHIPPNKGRKGYHAPGSEKGWFKNGHTPWNKLPIGSVVKKDDGYYWRKIGEGARDWKQEHRIMWEEANGPIPEGMKLTFLDGNRENLSLDNLMLITNNEHGLMTANRLRSSNPTLTKTGVLTARLSLALKNKKKGTDDED